MSRLAARSILWSRCRLPGAGLHPACAVQCPAPGRGCFNEAGPGMAGHANNTTVEVWHSPDPNYWDLTLRDLTSGEHQDSGIRWDLSSERAQWPTTGVCSRCDHWCDPCEEDIVRVQILWKWVVFTMTSRPLFKSRVNCSRLGSFSMFTFGIIQII